VNEPIVLAYSGSIETAAAIRWLVSEAHADVATVTLDLGQEPGLEALRLRAVALGASRAHVFDMREAFARECLLPALDAGVFDDAFAPAGWLAHPLIARTLVEVAAIERATVVAHGGGSAEHESLQRAIRVLNPNLEVVAVAAAVAKAGGTLAEFAVGDSFATSAPAKRTYDVERTLWGRAVTWPAAHAEAPPEEIYALTRPAARTPDVPATVEVEFEDGIPVMINGVAMNLTELIESVTTIAGNHGVGRSARPDSHTVYEAPAAVVLTEAHDALTGGRHGRANGVVRMKLFKGEHTIVGHSPIPVPSLLSQHP